MSLLEIAHGLRWSVELVEGVVDLPEENVALAAVPVVIVHVYGHNRDSAQP